MLGTVRMRHMTDLLKNELFHDVWCRLNWLLVDVLVLNISLFEGQGLLVQSNMGHRCIEILSSFEGCTKADTS